MAGDARTSRRMILGAGIAAITCGAIWPTLASTIKHPKSNAIARGKAVDRRTLALHNLHTGEKFDEVYFANGRYEPGILHEINHILRDHRDGTVRAIDPRLLDLLVRLRQRLGTSAPYEVVCGYRSPETNAMMAAMSDGVAAGSLHMYGKAVDMRVPGRGLRQVNRAALSLKAGGVGYYPHSDFVHVDTGSVRHWT
jgi:uncharacterized protein YcbK (DUF882 family)